MHSKLIKAIKYFLYLGCILALISSIILLGIVFGSTKDLRVTAFISIFPFSIIGFTWFVLANSEKLWGRYASLILTILLWLAFFLDLFIYKHSGILTMLMWNVPFTILTYLLFR